MRINKYTNVVKNKLFYSIANKIKKSILSYRPKQAKDIKNNKLKYIILPLNITQKIESVKI